MTRPTPPLTDETELDRLRRALADAQADGQRHAEALSRLQAEVKAARLEVAGARTQAANYQTYFQTTQAALEAAHARMEAMLVAAAAQQVEIDRLRARWAGGGTVASLAAALASAAVRASRRGPGLLRAKGRGAVQAAAAFGRAARRGDVATPPAPPPPAPPPSGDPNDPYIFKPAQSAADGSPADGAGSVSLDDLHRLSRSL